MHLHSRVFNPLLDQEIPHELLELSLKVVQSRLQDGLYSQLSGLPFVEGLKKFPPILAGDMCWDGRTDTLDYLMSLSLKDIHDIEVALHKFKELGLPPNMLEPDLFPLPTELRYRLRTISHNLHKGVGLAVLRGLDPKRYSDEDNLIIYAGIVSWIGRERATNPLGMSAEHVRNALLDKKPADAAESELEPAKQPHKMNFHADRFMADVVALYVREKAATGGAQYVASFQSIYNELSTNHPKALAALMEDWAWPPSSEDSNADPIRGPAVFLNGQQVIAQLVWAPFIKNPSYLTPERERALTVVNDLAKKMCVKLDSKAGDIQLINNLGMLHARDNFVDNATQHRHLVRIGIRDPEHQWARPVGFETQFETAYRVPLSEQKMPAVDFDPWNATSTAALNHG